MQFTSAHLKWLTVTNESVVTQCGNKVPIYQFTPNALDSVALTEWARHFREHYCADNEIDHIKSQGMSRRDYFNLHKFPTTKAPGPSIKAGDFAEILVADYLEFLLGYSVPRTRYDRKTIRNESTKGSDVLAFKGYLDKPAATDELLIFEVKASFSQGKPLNRLQDAIVDSIKDEFRISESLNAAKQRYFDKKEYDWARYIGRFQLDIAQPYITNYGAAALLSSSRYKAEELAKANTNAHPFKNNLQLLVIRAAQFMDIANALYDRAANEA